MFCSKCGQVLPDDVKECSNCGSSASENNQAIPPYSPVSAESPATQIKTPVNIKRRTRIVLIVLVATFLLILFRLSFALLFSILPVNGFLFHIKNNSAVITQYIGQKENVTIPDKLLWFPVTDIQGVGNKMIYVGAFSSDNNLISVTIGKNVKIIGGGTFSDCPKLMSVKIPEGVTAIGNEAFTDCPNLKDVEIPKSVTSIGMNAFARSQWLKNYKGDFLIIGDGLLFAYKGKSADVVIPDNVKRINNRVFSDNTKIKSVKMPGTLLSIGESAFENTALTSVAIPENVKDIGAYAFDGCSALTSVKIPSSVTAIGDYAFGYKQNGNYEFNLIPGFKIICSENSAGYKYAKDNGIECIINN